LKTINSISFAALIYWSKIISAPREAQFYAAALNKFPKTPANRFALYGHKTPRQIIREQVTLEAERLLYYTDMTGEEIAYDLGFDDPAHFSRFFKNLTAASPSEFKNSTNS
jgi:AraC-like DNA-binding protein